MKPYILKFSFIFFITSGWVFYSHAGKNKVDSLKIMMKQNVHDTVKLKKMMDVAWDSFRTLPEQSLGIIKNALVLANKLSRIRDEAKCNNIAGIIYSTTGKYDSASCYYSKYLAIGLKLKDDKILSKGYANVGLNYHYQGIYDKALEYHFKSLPLYEKIPDSLGLANTLANIGNTFNLMKSVKNSMFYLEKALLVFEQIKNKRGVANTLNSLGSAYGETDSLRHLAKDCYLRSLKIKEELNDRFGISNTLSQIAISYGKEKDYEKELEFYRKALAIKRGIGDKSGITKTLVNIGFTNNSLKRYHDALPYFLEALKISEETENYFDRQQVYSGLAATYAKAGEFEKAYNYKKLFAEISDTIMNREKAKQIIEIQTKYESEKKQKENEILTKENKIKTLEVNRQKNQRVILIIIFVFIFSAGFLVFNRIRLKQENKILVEKKLRAGSVFQAQEREKVHLSKELHDGLGPLLSLIKLNASGLAINEENEKMIREIKELASDGIKEVRNISHILMPALLEKQGLEPALREFTGQINQSHSLQTTMEFSINSKLTRDAELNIYRIIQEALNNIMKHAEATTATVQLSENKQQIGLVVSDNGKGFDTGKVSAGNGLNNILSRVDYLKGRADVKSEINKGTVITILIQKDGNTHA